MTDRTHIKPAAKQSTRKSENGMVDVARENERAHLAPVQGASAPHPRPFPAMLGWGLLGGVLIGALAGWFFGWLLLSGSLVVPGWEQLYSMSPGTFTTFWTGIGIAAGILIGGVGTILAAPVPQKRRDMERDQG